MDKLADVCPFRSHVVKLKELHFRLGTVLARVAREEISNEPLGCCAATFGGFGDLPSMKVAALAEVPAEAFAAPPLVAISAPVEVRDWKLLLAPAAPAQELIGSNGAGSIGLGAEFERQ